MTAKNLKSRVLRAFAVGTTIESKYRVEEEIGSGQMGLVLRAHELTLGRDVALKVLFNDMLAPQQATTLFVREARGMARVQHQNVVPVYNFGEHEGFPFLVSEYVPGQSLDDYLEQHEMLRPEVALGIIEQAAAGLDAVHAAGLVHGDVKPANFLISRDYRVRLCDFGLTRLRGQNPMFRGGTPMFMAPELIVPTKIDAADAHLSDIYALGALAFLLLTGVDAFPGDSVEAVLEDQLNAPRPLASEHRPGLGTHFDSILVRALDLDPTKRFTTALSLSRSLRGAHQQAMDAAGQPSHRVLVVDDDPDIVAIYSMAFEAAFPGAEVATADDGLAALQLAALFGPDLIVSDLQMPQLDGVALCRRLKADPQMSKIPLMVVSGAVEGERKTLREIGVDEALGKPVDPRTLVSVARGLLTGSTEKG